MCKSCFWPLWAMSMKGQKWGEQIGNIFISFTFDSISVSKCRLPPQHEPMQHEAMHWHNTMAQSALVIGQHAPGHNVVAESAGPRGQRKLQVAPNLIGPPPMGPLLLGAKKQQPFA